MRRVIPKIRLLTYQQSPDSGTEVVALILEHRGNNYHLEGATKDIIHVFTSGAAIYVLTISKARNTISLFAYMVPEPDCINMFVLHDTKQIREYLGSKWESMKPEAIAIKLMEYLY
jgi:hypothetical protein